MEDTNTPAAALRRAVEKLGSQAAMAELCMVTPTAVWKWLDQGKALPAEHVLRAERETGVSRHDLRPDIYPRETGSIGSPDTLHAPGIAADQSRRPCDRRSVLQSDELAA